MIFGGVQIAVLTTVKRKPVAMITLAELDERAGCKHFSHRAIYCGAEAGTDPAWVSGWVRHTWRGPIGQIQDYREMISRLDPSKDAILFEDDVQPCRNAALKMATVDVPEDCAFLSFYDSTTETGPLSGIAPGIYKHKRPRAFYGSQAIKLPARVISRLQTFQVPDDIKGSDTWLAAFASASDLSIGVYSPSLVQHVGHDSHFSPGSRLTGVRAPTRRFPGEDYDATGIEVGTDVSGPATGRPPITWCSFHGCHHADAIVCPCLS